MRSVPLSGLTCILWRPSGNERLHRFFSDILSWRIPKLRLTKEGGKKVEERWKEASAESFDFDLRFNGHGSREEEATYRAPAYIYRQEESQPDFTRIEHIQLSLPFASIVLYTV